MAPAGHIVPAARGGATSAAQGLDFPLFWPLTCRAPLWHNVTRRPRRGILGFLSPRFSSPVAADAFISRFCRFADLPFCRFAAAVCSGSDRIPVLRVFYTGYIYIPCKNGKTGNPDRCRNGRTDGFAVLRGEAANRQNDGFLSQPAFSAICGPTAKRRSLVLRADPQIGKTMKS